MTDNVIPFRPREPVPYVPVESTNFQCPDCGGEWFESVVVFNADMTEVTGWILYGPFEDSAPTCHDCGRPVNEGPTEE